MATDPQLMAVPNFSEGQNDRIVRALESTLGSSSEVLNVHYDSEHNRSVFTLAALPGPLAESLLAGAEHAAELIDLRAHHGLHPRIGALDVCPVVYRDDSQRELARDTALEVAKQIAAKLEIPIFLYGELASSEERRERAYFRRGGPAELARRMESGELKPDFGPHHAHPTAGATLVTGRPPLVAFNVRLDASNPEVARAVAEKLREGGGGLPGVRAIGLPLSGPQTQVSVNVHDPDKVPLAKVTEEIERFCAEHDSSPVEAELVGLAPEAALEQYPRRVPIKGFDPDEHILERRLER
jgi:glutamate formiminotransferase